MRSGELAGHEDGHHVARQGWRFARQWCLALLASMLLVPAAHADSLAIVSGGNQSGLSGAAASQPVVVEARNSMGNPVSGRSIAWTASNGFTLTSATTVTDATGRASVGFTYGPAGSSIIRATDAVGSTAAQTSATATGSDSLTLLSGNGQTGQVGQTSQPVVVELRSAGGAPRVGRTINWSNPVAGALVTAATSVTDANGRASMTFRYVDNGQPLDADGAPTQVRATDSQTGLQVTASATVIGFNGHPFFVSGANQSIPIGATSALVVVQARTWDGQPMAGVSLTFTEMATLGGGRDGDTSHVTLSAPSAVTGPDGKASFTYTCDTLPPNSTIQNRDGRIRIAFGLADIDANYNCEAKYSVLPVSPRELYIPANSGGTAEVEVRDVNGQLWVGKTVNWFSDDPSQLVPGAGSSVTNASGRATMPFTTTPTFVNTVLYAKIPELFARQFIYNGTNPGAVTVVWVSGLHQSGPIGTPLPQPLVAEVRDSAGNPLAGRTVNIGPGSNNLGGTETTVSPATAVTDGAGQVSAIVTPRTPGEILFNAIDALSGVTAIGRLYGTGVDSMSLVSGGNQSGLPGAHSAAPVIIEMRDATNSPITGRTVHWNINGGNCVFDAATSVTDAAGRASMGFTFAPVAGLCGLEARDNSNQVQVGFFAVGVSADSFSLISGNGQSGPSATAAAQPLVVEVRDAAGNAAVGRIVNWSATNGAILGSPSSVTDASGRASNTLTYPATSTSVAGTVTATDATTGYAANFTYAAFALAPRLNLVSGIGQSGVPGTDAAQPIVVRLLDGSGNPFPGQTVTAAVSGDAVLTSGASAVTNASGDASFSFRFGVTPSASIITFSGGGSQVQTAVSALASNRALTIISGDNQSLEVGQLSDPMVVELRDIENHPVAGAIITWTGSNATTAAPSSTTDANGRASTTATVTASGEATVQASTVLASAPVTFTISIPPIADIPTLTPEQEVTAIAIDNACDALSDAGSLTPEQQDLLLQCLALGQSAGENSDQTVAALQELINDSALAQSNAAESAAVAQLQNVTGRLAAIRSGSNTSSLSGLALAGPGGLMSFESLMQAFSADQGSEAGDAAGADFGRWGVWASGTIGRGETDPGSVSPGFDYDINGLSFGIDRRQNDRWILGGALGYSSQDTDLEQNGGTVDMQGWSASIYSTYTFAERWYVDGVVVWGRNQFDIRRNINYTLTLPGGATRTINQVASGDPDASYLELALTLGGDFSRGAWNFGPYARLTSSRTEFDAYLESMRAGAGSGLGLAVESRRIDGFSALLGGRLSYTHSADWGVLVPSVSMEWQHEFKDDPDTITARFIHDPTNTPIVISGDPIDSNFLRLGLGLSMVLTEGRSGFLLYERTAARDRQSLYNVSLGFRWEF